MRVHISPSARRNLPPLFEPPESPTDDNPLLPGRRQRGTTRASQLAVLDTAFTEAKDASLQRGGKGPATMRYSLDPLRQVLAKKLPVRLATYSAADALHAITQLQDLGVSVVLERPVQVGPLASMLAEKQIPCVLAMPLRPANLNPGDFKKNDETPRARPEAAGVLARAGVRVAIVPASDGDLSKLRMLAGLACRFRMPKRNALGAITLEAAKILGVDARVGSIAEGKDGDLVALSGDPFDARSQVDIVLSDGQIVHERKDSEAVFVLRASRVLLGDGREHAPGTVVVRGGKIADVGTNVPVPPGAEIIDFGKSVLAPGFVAAATRLWTPC